MQLDSRSRTSPPRLAGITGLALILLLASALPAFAGPKEDLYAQMLDIATQVQAVKGQTDSQSTQELANLLQQYRQLSAQLGGDDPAGLVSSAAGGQLGPVTKGDEGSLLPPGCSEALATGSNMTATAINDNSSFTSTIDISSPNTYTWSVILDTSITHTFPGDLDITLTSPAGTEVTITTDNGGTADDAFDGTTWNDEAGVTNPPGPVTDATYTTGVTSTPLVVEEALSAFEGEDPNGTWTLEVGDDAGGDTGSLDSWSLEISTFPVAPTVGATSSGSNMTATPINDNTSFTSTATIAGADTFVCDAELETFITHSFPGDLDITITSPLGTVVTVTTDNGGTADDAFDGTVWNDDAGDTTTPGPVTDHAYSTGVLASPLTVEEAMAAFRGEDPNGLWTLEVGDDAGGDTGSLDQWTISVTSCSCGSVGPGPGTVFDPAVPMADGFGLALLALLLAGAALFAFRRAS